MLGLLDTYLGVSFRGLRYAAEEPAGTLETNRLLVIITLTGFF